MGTLTNIASTVLGLLQTRLALLVNEVQIQKQQALQQVWCNLALLFCLGVGVLLAVALAVLVWWDQRLFVLASSMVLFLGLAVYFWMALHRSVEQTTPLFAVSLAELQEDLRQLKEAAGHESAPH